MSSVEEIIAKIASDLRRQKIGQQALNASAKLNQIELLGEEAKLLDTLYADRNRARSLEQTQLSDYTFTLQQTALTNLVDVARVMYAEL